MHFFYNSRDVRSFYRDIYNGGMDKMMKEMLFEELCQGISIKAVKISPNGTYISYIKKNIEGEHLNIINYSSKTITINCEKKFTNIIGCVWSSSSKYILVIEDSSGNGLWKLYRYNLSKNDIDNEISVNNSQVKVYGIDKKRDCAIIGINKRNPLFFDVYSLDIKHWNTRLIFKNDYYFRILFDHDCNIRLGCRMSKGGSYYVENIKSMKTVFHVKAEDFFGTFPLCVTSDNQLLLRDSRNRDKSVIAKMSLDSNETRVLASSDKVDVEESFIDPLSGDVEAVAFYYTKKEWTCFNKEVEDNFKVLKKFNAGDISITSTSSNGSRWIVEYSNSDFPLQYALFERNEKKVIKLFSNVNVNNRALYVKKQPIVTTNCNGENILCYLMEPHIYNNKGLLVFLHGGPWQRDVCKFVYLHQWLVNKGYYILTINYRGSQGFGKAFLNAASKDWVKVLNEDIVVAINKIIIEKALDVDKIAVMGNSFGGYLAQLGVTERPDIFKCGISIGGVSNLKGGLESFPVHKGFQKDIFREYMNSGDPESIYQQSPICKISRKTNSLFLVHGYNDPIVNVKETISMVKKMNDNNLNILGVIFSNEGHSIKKVANRIYLYKILDKFLSYYLLDHFDESKLEINNQDITVFGNLKDTLF